MATKPIVLLVHGMGSFTPPNEGANQLGSFGQAFVDAADASLAAFANHSGESIQEHVDIEECHYNDIFETVRENMSEDATNLQTRLGNIEAIFAGGSFLQTFVGKLNGWEQRFGEEEFFYTHWLDVLFYTTYIGEAARTRFAEKLSGLIEETDSRKIHVIAHSLGTAVTHDALMKIYPPGGVPVPGSPDNIFSVENDQIGSLWMFANVSKLVNSVTPLPDPLSEVTTVKPGNGGCTKRFYNVRHELDPFTMILRFDPRNDGAWLSQDTYRLRYKAILNDIVIDANTHSFTQYIKDPNVSLSLLPKLMGSSKFRPTKAEIETLISDHANSGINGAFARLHQEFGGIDISDLDTIDDFLTAGEDFRAAIEGIREQLQG